MSRQAQMQVVLDNLTRSISGMKGSFLCTLDGMPVGHAINDPAIDPARVAAMAATALGVGRRITETLSIGHLRGLQLVAGEGRVFIYMVDNKACLALVAPSETNVGLIELEAASVIAQLASIL